MSRIGKLSIKLPDKTTLEVKTGEVTVKGPKGTLQVPVPEGITVKAEAGVAVVHRPSEDRQVRALHGLTRALLANAVQGVSKGFVKELEIQGTGYKAEAKGKELHLALGYSHPVVYALPEGVSAKTPAPTKIILESADKQKVGMAAAQIRDLRPPEPYKGKGIRYADERVRRKVGKTAA